MRNSLKLLMVVLVFGLVVNTSYADRYSSGGKGAPTKADGKSGELKFDEKTDIEFKQSAAGRKAPSVETEKLKTGAAAAPISGTTGPINTSKTSPAAPKSSSPSKAYGGPRITKKAEAVAPGKTLETLDAAAQKAADNGMGEVASDIRKYRADVEKKLKAGGVEDGKLIVAQRMNDMVDSMVAARADGRCDGVCDVIAKEALARGDGVAELEQVARYFGKNEDGSARLDKEAIQGLGSLVMTWKDAYDAARKAGKSDAEAKLEAGRKTDQWLMAQLGKTGYGDFCKASKAGKTSATVAATPNHGSGRGASGANRAKPEEMACPLPYMGVCNLAI